MLESVYGNGLFCFIEQNFFRRANHKPVQCNEVIKGDGIFCPNNRP